MKTIIKLAWKNIWRSRKRTFFTLVAITVSITMFIFIRSYINGIMSNATATIIKTSTGHIKILHKEFLRKERVMPKEYLIGDIESKIDKLKKHKEVKSAEQKIKFPVLLSVGSESEGCLAMGINPVKADKTMKLSELIIEGEYIKEGAKELIIGEGLAKKLKVKTGDEILIVTTDINYSTYALPFKVKGVFKSGFSAMDKHVIYIPYTRAAEMIDAADSAHEILIYLKDKELAETFADRIRPLFSKEISIIPWTKDRIIRDVMPLAQAIWGKMLGIIMLITGLVILNTMLMSVMERFHEMGLLKAMGMKNREINMMIFTEAAIMGTIGSLTGGLFGGALGLYTEINGINIAKLVGGGAWDKIDIPVPIISNIVYPDINAEILFGSILFGVLLTLAAVIWPAVKTNRMKPVEAFRTKLNV